MAHNLNWNASLNRHAFFSAKQKAWHNLGEVVENTLTSEEAIKKAGLDYKVDLVETFAMINGVYQLVPKSFATFRTDTGEILGNVGNRYNVVQNSNAFEFFDAIVGKDEAIFETAGALGKGEKVFITAKFPNYIKVGKDDLSEMYCFLTNSHDGTGSVIAALTSVRIVCNNTLQLALKKCTNKVAIKHTANAVDKLKKAHEIMGISNRLSGELETIFNLMAKTPCNDDLMKDIIFDAFVTPDITAKLKKGEEISTRFENIVSDVFAYAMSAETQQMPTTRGTIFGAYNAVTGYFQNVKKYDTESKEDKFVNIFEGTGKVVSEKAFDLCLANCN